MEEQNEIWEIVKYKMDSEGFDYCFNGYSNWQEVDDIEFQRLRQEYKDSAERLKNYVESK